MEENSLNPLERATTDVATPSTAVGHVARTERAVSSASALTEEEVAAFRADLARMREAMREARERLEGAKVVSQAALAFEVSLVL